jgi:hypothetical protein
MVAKKECMMREKKVDEESKENKESKQVKK